LSEVYQTKIVEGVRKTLAQNFFSNLEAAKAYLEAYASIHYGGESSLAWDHREDQLEEWVAPGIGQGRAVIMNPDVHDDAEELIEKTREVYEEFEAGIDA